MDRSKSTIAIINLLIYLPALSGAHFPPGNDAVGAGLVAGMPMSF